MYYDLVARDLVPAIKMNHVKRKKEKRKLKRKCYFFWSHLALYAVLVTGLPSSASWQDLKVRTIFILFTTSFLFCFFMWQRYACLLTFTWLYHEIYVLNVISCNKILYRITCVEQVMSVSPRFSAMVVVSRVCFSSSVFCRLLDFCFHPITLMFPWRSIWEFQCL